ncbi:hypothetical protein Ahia01_000768900, partial [Argonauta hians]
MIKIPRERKSSIPSYDAQFSSLQTNLTKLKQMVMKINQQINAEKKLGQLYTMDIINEKVTFLYNKYQEYINASEERYEQKLLSIRASCRQQVKDAISMIKEKMNKDNIKAKATDFDKKENVLLLQRVQYLQTVIAEYETILDEYNSPIQINTMLLRLNKVNRQEPPSIKTTAKKAQVAELENKKEERDAQIEFLKKKIKELEYILKEERWNNQFDKSILTRKVERASAKEKERERQREKERQKEREREKERQKEREIEKWKEKQRETERQIEREREEQRQNELKNMLSDIGMDKLKVGSSSLNKLATAKKSITSLTVPSRDRLKTSSDSNLTKTKRPQAYLAVSVIRARQKFKKKKMVRETLTVPRKDQLKSSSESSVTGQKSRQRKKKKSQETLSSDVSARDQMKTSSESSAMVNKTR